MPLKLLNKPSNVLLIVLFFFTFHSVRVYGQGLSDDLEETLEEESISPREARKRASQEAKAAEKRARQEAIQAKRDEVALAVGGILQSSIEGSAPFLGGSLEQVELAMEEEEKARLSAELVAPEEVAPPAFVKPVKGAPLKPSYSLWEEGFFFTEGEHAVTTNFSTRSKRDYGVSGNRVLELQANKSRLGDEVYFAEYVIEVTTSGQYDFWYGGTPPGLRDPRAPSYASSFRYSIDGGAMLDIYGENVVLGENYSSYYHWLKVGGVSLSEGTHVLRIEVPRRRLYNGEFRFSIDALFFIKADKIASGPTYRPSVFPTDLSPPATSYNPISVDYYENLIRRDPRNINLYTALSRVYSLMGDYASAIRTLERGAKIAPRDEAVLRLLGRNRIWYGEVVEGLYAYRELLYYYPKNRAYWVEAATAASDAGELRLARKLLEDGIVHFPEDPTLDVYRSVVYRDLGSIDFSEGVFERLKKRIQGDAASFMALGDLYRGNGYYKLAAEAYEEAIRLAPSDLLGYRNLERVYRLQGQHTKAEGLLLEVAESFDTEVEPFPYYNALVQGEKALREKRYLEGLYYFEEREDALASREQLAQFYYWDGQQAEGTDHTFRLLMNRLYRSVKDFDEKGKDFLNFYDRFYTYYSALKHVRGLMRNAEIRLYEAYSSYIYAVEARDRRPGDKRRADRAQEMTLAYVQTYSEYQQWLLLAEKSSEVLLRVEKEWARLLTEETRAQEAWLPLVEETGWEWDKDLTFKEIRRIRQNEPYIADYLSSRLSLFLGMPQEAARYIEEAGGRYAGDPFAQYGLYQAYAWGQLPSEQIRVWKENRDLLTSYKPHVAELDLLLPSPRGSTFSIPTQEDIALLLKDLSQATPPLGGHQQRLEELVKEVGEAMEKRFTRHMYLFEREFSFYRLILGAEYTALGRYNQGVEQLERYIMIESRDLDGIYRLASAKNGQGRWSEAMELYKKVYNLNPYYKRTMANYDRLATEHGDRASFRLLFPLTGTRQGRGVGVAFETKPNQFFSWGLDYTWLNDKKIAGDKVDAQGGDPSVYRAHKAGGTLGFYIPSWKVALRPWGGMVLFLDNAYNDSFAPYENLGPASNFEFGASIEWNPSIFTGKLDFRYALDPDSYFPDTPFENVLTVGFDGELLLPIKTPRLGPIVSTTKADYGMLAGGASNVGKAFKGILQQEFTLGYSFTSAPKFGLELLLRGEVGDGTYFEPKDFYIANDYYKILGGLRGSLGFFNEERTENLDLFFLTALGSFTMDNWAEIAPDSGFAMTIGLNLEYQRHSMVLYANMDADLIRGLKIPTAINEIFFAGATFTLGVDFKVSPLLARW